VPLRRLPAVSTVKPRDASSLERSLRRRKIGIDYQNGGTAAAARRRALAGFRSGHAPQNGGVIIHRGTLGKQPGGPTPEGPVRRVRWRIVGLYGRIGSRQSAPIPSARPAQGPPMMSLGIASFLPRHIHPGMAAAAFPVSAARMVIWRNPSANWG